MHRSSRPLAACVLLCCMLAGFLACSSPYTIGTIGGGDGEQSSSGGGSPSGSSGQPSASAGGSSGAPQSSSGGQPVTPDICELTAERRALLDALNAVRAAAPGASPPLPMVDLACLLIEPMEEWTRERNCAENIESPTANVGVSYNVIFGGHLYEPGDSLDAALRYYATYGRDLYNRANNSCPSTSREYNTCMMYRMMVRREMSSAACAVGPVCGQHESGKEIRRFVCAFLPAPEDPLSAPY